MRGRSVRSAVPDAGPLRLPRAGALLAVLVALLAILVAHPMPAAGATRARAGRPGPARDRRGPPLDRALLRGHGAAAGRARRRARPARGAAAVGRSRVLRFGGSSVDAVTAFSATGDPVPWARTTIVPADFDRLAALTRRTGWRVLLAVNLGRHDAASAAAEAPRPPPGWPRSRRDRDRQRAERVHAQRAARRRWDTVATARRSGPTAAPSRRRRRASDRRPGHVRPRPVARGVRARRAPGAVDAALLPAPQLLRRVPPTAGRS